MLSAFANDPRHRVLRETLLRYVQKGKSVRRRANSLGIHPNTLYQRLQRIEAVNGRNMADASDFTLLSLACQTYAEYQDDSASPEENRRQARRNTPGMNGIRPDCAKISATNAPGARPPMKPSHRCSGGDPEGSSPPRFAVARARAIIQSC
ncbi:helix-turn-helix domain-containing protein [Rhizobium lentis]|uniref:helix-turn-helix domain-containing protein n=1 Tax=Rhizobium lentis TaxID=1138194 RepID=UPI0035C91431